MKGQRSSKAQGRQHQHTEFRNIGGASAENKNKRLENSEETEDKVMS